jgi:uncharacterized protein (DUF697 family)
MAALAASKEAWAIIAANLAVANACGEGASVEWAVMMLRLALLQRMPLVTQATLLSYNSRCGMQIARVQATSVRRAFEVYRQASKALSAVMPLIRLVLSNAGAVETASAVGGFTEAVDELQQHGEGFFERLARDAGMAGEEGRAWESRLLELVAQLTPSFERLANVAIRTPPP